MIDTVRPRALQVLRWDAVAIALLVCARTAWRPHESATLVRLSKPLQRAPAQPVMQLLIVGDPFVQPPQLNAADGLHPSDAGYRVWFDELMVQAALLQRLAATLRPDR